jgi:hypothetical protein
MLVGIVQKEIMEGSDLSTLPSRVNFSELKITRREFTNHVSKLSDIIQTMRQINRLIINYQTVPRVESAEMDDGLIQEMKVQETLTDVHGSAENYDYSVSFYSDQGQQHMLSLDDFFSRPVLVASGSFPLDNFDNYQIDVWDLYTKDPTVRAKLRNYAYLQASLHIRLCVSGTPFHYGKILASYQHYPYRNDVLQNLYGAYIISNNYRKCVLNYLSQSPNRYVIDVRENQPLEMVIPYMSHKPMFRLFNGGSIITDTASYDDIGEAGSLYLEPINPIRSTNSGSDSVTFQLYVWLEDVKLGTTTGTQVAIRTESKVKDERETGPVERFSSGAKDISKALTSVPFIRPFALASSIGFGALEKISAIFGWARPIVIEPPHFVKNVPFQNGAHVIGSETVFKLSLDPKQELTVDNRIGGTDVDEMSLSHIASQESYLTTFEWNVSDVQRVSIFDIAVMPHLVTAGSRSGTGANLILQPTAMCFAATPFDAWRGDVEITFEFACNQFHRGKIMFMFEPNVTAIGLINADIKLNQHYIKVLDLQESQSITFCVPWAHARAWCRTRPPASNTHLPYTDPLLPFSATYDQSNGYITVAPFTHLVSPGDTAIQVNVYVKCPNLMVNRFTQQHMPAVRNIITESYVRVESEVDTLHRSSQPVTCVKINDSTATSDTICLEHFGERPVSFRSLLKRYVTQHLLTATSATPSTSQSLARLFLPLYPLPEVRFSGASTDTRTLYGYLRYAYMGMRGSTRHRLRILCNDNLEHHAQVRASLTGIDNTNDVDYATFTVNSTTLRTTTNCVMNGTIALDLDSNGGFEIEIPYYSNNLYEYSFATDLSGNNPGGEDNHTTFWSRRAILSWIFKAAAATFTTFVSCEMATGEDFNFIRFQGAPYYNVI